MFSELLQSFAKSVDEVSASRAPYNEDGDHRPHTVVDDKIRQLIKLIEAPAFRLDDLPAYLDAIKHQGSLDDRELLLEKILVLMSRLEDSRISRTIQEHAIALLYNDLPHPPNSYLTPRTNEVTQNPTSPATLNGAPVKYAFRSADGSCYNPASPSLGKAGSPYARSVQALKPMPKHVLPEPGLVFDTLLRRKKFVEHPSGISSLFFAFADLVIHTIFDTDHHVGTTNKASSYLDLSILYGSSEDQVNSVRRKDGSGRLHDDVFADSRLLMMPPASCALLVLLNRNHNYIAQRLLDINEGGEYVWPPSKERLLVQDDEIFHRTRLVNCGYFMNIILGDYVGAILGLVRDGSGWRLDPLMNMRESDHEVSPRGTGNVVSIEFNLLYRWHATLSEEDTRWTTDLFEKTFPGKSLRDLTPQDFMTKVHDLFIPDPDVKHRTFKNLKRYNGRFKDEDLAKILQDATDWPAASFGSGIPEALRVIEIMGIEESRKWGTCSLNEFRKFLGLKPYETFAQWNPNPDIHTKAAALYKDIDNLELHVGLQAEQCKTPGPGAGLCPGYTISRAILADAVCLTRGDPYLTTEFTPQNCTLWGYNDVQYDKKDGSYGGLLTKLLFRTLPDHYPAGSAYAHFPFLVPSWMKHNFSTEENLKEDVHKYIWERPTVPTPTVTIDSYNGVKEVLSHPEYFMSAYGKRLLNILQESSMAQARYTIPVPVIDKSIKESPSDAALASLVEGRLRIGKIISSATPRSHSTWAEYFKEKTDSLIKEKSFPNDTDKTYVLDIVHDVINVLPIYWLSEEILGLPLKTLTNQRGSWREDDIYKNFASISRYVYSNFDLVDDWHLRLDSVNTFKEVFKQTLAHLEALNFSVFGGGILDSFDEIKHGHHNSHHFLKHVLEALATAHKPLGLTDITTYLLATVVPTSAIFSQAITHVVAFYLDEGREKERANIVELSATLHQNQGNVDKVMVYVREALRLNPPVSGVYRTATQEVSIQGFGTVNAGDRVFASLIEANLDADKFGDHPEHAVYDRLPEQAGIFGLGEHGLLSSSFFNATVPTIVGTLLSLKNIKCQSKLACVVEPWHSSKRQLYLGFDGKVTPFPESLSVSYV